MKIGYKGFDKNLKCKDHQFVIGEIAEKPAKDKPKLCSTDGFHYCNKLENVYGYYSLNKENRFCEVEILGPFTDDHEKSITTSLRVIREIPYKELIFTKIENNIHLDIIKAIQTKYPLIHIGGSVGLFLHGVVLNRLKDGQCDLDMVTPYWTAIETIESLKEDEDDFEVMPLEGKKSSKDFHESYIINGTKLDLRVDPYQKYSVIKYKDFNYKVSPF